MYGFYSFSRSLIMNSGKTEEFYKDTLCFVEESSNIYFLTMTHQKNGALKRTPKGLKILDYNGSNCITPTTPPYAASPT